MIRYLEKNTKFLQINHQKNESGKKVQIFLQRKENNGLVYLVLKMRRNWRRLLSLPRFH